MIMIVAVIWSFLWTLRVWWCSSGSCFVLSMPVLAVCRVSSYTAGQVVACIWTRVRFVSTVKQFWSMTSPLYWVKTFAISLNLPLNWLEAEKVAQQTTAEHWLLYSILPPNEHFETLFCLAVCFIAQSREVCNGATVLLQFLQWRWCALVKYPDHDGEWNCS